MWRQYLKKLFVLLAFITISSYFFEEISAKKYVFKPRDAINMSHWKQKLYRKTIGKLKKMTKIRIPFPKIPKTKPKRIIKEVDTKKHNPCLVVKNVCVNGGICQSLDDEWYCNCPTTHYGKSCEFLADQTHCTGHFCKNNSTCYSVKAPRTAPNPNVTAVMGCSKAMIRDSSFEGHCNYTLNLMYKCWCKFGFEGEFCEFTEGMRCCAEDHCNHHGLIDFNQSLQYDAKQLDENKENMSCENTTCKCRCEKYYSDDDDCLTISPCRDHECYNEGECEVNDDSKEPFCSCPDASKFLNPRVNVKGKNCEQIESPDDLNEDDKKCTPCSDDIGFKDYIECLQRKLDDDDETKGIGIRIEDYFARDCINATGDHNQCKEMLGSRGFCLNCEGGGCCQVSVSNLTELVQADKNGKPLLLSKPLFLIPKCECPPEYDGDFCENRQLDECDLKDLEQHGAYLERIGPDADNRTTRLGKEGFLRAVKTKFHQWQPAHSSARGKMASEAFERALRSYGMKTFCGFNGYCRPYDEEEGMGCKCASGYRGSRCELKDPCSPNPCKMQKTDMCIDIPITDEGSEGGNYTYACICDTSQVMDPKEHQCTREHSEYYSVSFDGDNEPKCRHSGSCYPCKLDEKAMRDAGVHGTRLGRSMAICSEAETKRGLRCLCPPGFEQPWCGNETTGCDYHQCQNGAKCEVLADNPLDYRCICPPGYGPRTENTLCQIIEQICVVGASMCKSGSCVEDSGVRRRFRCVCHSGYFGFNCEHVEARDFIAYINNNYNWTYPLIIFSLMLPIFLLISLIKDGLISCVWMVNAWHRLMQRVRRRGRGGAGAEYRKLQEDQGEDQEESTQQSTNTAKSSSFHAMDSCLISEHR